MSWETSDGAALGVKPERALETILGGAPPPPAAECMSLSRWRCSASSRCTPAVRAFTGRPTGANPALVEVG